MPHCHFGFMAKTLIFQPMKLFLLAVWLLALSPGGAMAVEPILFAENFAGRLTNGCENVLLYKKRTDYVVQQAGTNFFLHAAADNSCSALTWKLNLAPSAKIKLRWRWRIDSVATNGSEHDLKRFDHAARVFVAFDTFIGPPRTLNYFWANQEPPGTLLDHPMTGRAKMFIVESGNAKAGTWIAEERDVTADWKRAFPAKPMPKLAALGVLTDGDSLETKLSGDYANIELIAE